MVKRKLNQNNIAYGQLHGAVLLFALCGLFGKWIDLPAIIIVAGRCVFACLAIFIYVKLNQHTSLKINQKQFRQLSYTGLLLAIHWFSFFYCIELSSVTLGLVTFACFPMFVSALSLFSKHEQPTWGTLAQAVVVLVGLFLVVSDEQLTFNLEATGYGLASAFSFAWLTLVNRQFIQKMPAITISFYQTLVASLLLIPATLGVAINASANDLMLLIILGLVFTALAHILFISSLAIVNAQVASISICLEPIYGITAAVFLLQEPMTVNLAMGASLIIAINLYNIYRSKDEVD